MPIVRIDFLEGKAPEHGVQVGLIVARAMTEVLNVPKDDLFQVITAHTNNRLAVRSGLSWHPPVGRLHIFADHAEQRENGRDETAFLQSGGRRAARRAQAAQRRRLDQPGGSA